MTRPKLNPLALSSSIFYFGSMAANFLALLYQILMAHRLPKIEYAALNSLFGLLYLASIPTNALDIFVTKIVSSHQPSDLQGISNFFRPLTAKIVRYSLIFALPLILVAPAISHFLFLPNPWGVYLVWLSTFLLVLSIIQRGVLKGTLQFNRFTTNQIAEIGTRLGLGFLAILFLPVHFFALGAATLGSLVGVLLARSHLATLPPANHEAHLATMSLGKLGLATFVLSASFTAMYSVDVLLVKHFFTSDLAAAYGVLATAGKMVYFALSPISALLLPLVARRASHPASTRPQLGLMLLANLGIGLFILLLFTAFPSLIISLLASSSYLAIAPLLPYIGLSVLLYAVAFSLGNFLLAINQLKVGYFALGIVLAQVVLISLFHSTLAGVITILIVLFAILSLTFGLTSLYATRTTH